MEFFKWLYNNKQAIIGYAVAGLAYLQATDKLQTLISANAYEWTMLVIGFLMVIFARSASGTSVVNKVLPPSIPPGGPG